MRLFNKCSAAWHASLESSVLASVNSSSALSLQKDLHVRYPTIEVAVGKPRFDVTRNSL